MICLHLRYSCVRKPGLRELEIIPVFSLFPPAKFLAIPTMNANKSNINSCAAHSERGLNRRKFLGGALALTASGSSFASFAARAAESASPESKPPVYERKIKLGVIGNGGRGAWIAGLFQRHGGYEVHAVADYFQEVADKCGDANNASKGLCLLWTRWSNGRDPRAVAHVTRAPGMC